MFELILGDVMLSVPAEAIAAKCKCFTTPYGVRSNVSPDALPAFAGAVVGNAINIASDNVRDLSHLAGKFLFIDLQRELLVKSRITSLDSDYRRFLCGFDDRHSHFP
jgi:hypothetical protein